MTTTLHMTLGHGEKRWGWGSGESMHVHLYLNTCGRLHAFVHVRKIRFEPGISKMDRSAPGDPA